MMQILQKAQLASLKPCLPILKIYQKLLQLPAADYWPNDAIRNLEQQSKMTISQVCPGNCFGYDVVTTIFSLFFFQHITDKNAYLTIP